MGKFALPHEDAWEYACRGGLGNQRPYYWGHILNGTEANCFGEGPFGTTLKGPALARTSQVGNYATKAPHPWGLCDMCGNVWQWCSNLSGGGDQRACRGASWNNYCRGCRTANRSADNPSNRASNHGLRILLPIE